MWQMFCKVSFCFIGETEKARGHYSLQCESNLQVKSKAAEHGWCCSYSFKRLVQCVQQLKALTADSKTKDVNACLVWGQIDEV